ncbi:MAG: pyridoxamine 5'-phosphate oxidase family protein [Myxococcales bacterium]|nr:pyridoxamine 5'-phosphate oxidase family protein [Myxococcales bacterium]MDH5307817.1 pyridoxamine 5'-phosphate oxidase family protein [Myxococcales bacterium]MDH5565583.1 pyridoxamine 5'-phosphate oxidase family protein [Myxococcales bacterium]
MSSAASRMSAEQIESFLEAPRHAIVAVEQIDGPPLLSPVWYLYEAGRLYISVFADTAKCRNLRRDPRIGICVDAGHPDARFVSIYGRAELREGESPELEAMSWRITRRYCGSDEETRRYLDGLPKKPQAMIVVAPEKMFGLDYN